MPLWNWNGLGASWDSTEPSPNTSTPALGLPTPDMTNFDKTINPDSLVTSELEFGEPWTYTSSHGLLNMSTPISPTSPPSMAYHTPQAQYDRASLDYFDLEQPSPLIQSQLGSVQSFGKLEQQATFKQTPAHGSVQASASEAAMQKPVENREPTKVPKKRGSHSESQAHPRTRTNKSRSTINHNQIEKRYRTNLNDKIGLLRDSVPSLRALMDPDVESDDEESEEEIRAGKRRPSIAKVCRSRVMEDAVKSREDIEADKNRLRL
jgi:hypothetical protein